MFSNFVNFLPIDLKIGTHIDWTYNMFLAKKFSDQNNVTYVSMAAISSHYKAWGIFHKFTFFIYANNEDIFLKLLPDIYDHTLALYKN